MKNIKIILVLLVLASLNLYSQFGSSSEMDPTEMFDKAMKTSQSASEMMNSKQIPVSNIVDPDHYIVGAGDIMTLQILPQLPVEQYVTISPENVLIVPRFGSVYLKDKTLSEAREDIKKLILERNSKSVVSVTLRKPRMVLVTIRGNVKNPGTHSIPASYTVESAIKMANTIENTAKMTIAQSGAYASKAENEYQKEKIYLGSGVASKAVYYTRNIILARDNGKNFKVDLEKSHALNDFTFNPYVNAGDVIYVPFDKEEFPFIALSGAVNRPFQLPYKNGDKLSTVLKMSYGLKDNANLEEAYLFLPSRSSAIKIKVDNEANLLSEDYDLEPGSSIMISENVVEYEAKFGVIKLNGFVKIPGVYSIELGKTRIKDIVEKAGGFTEKAYLPLARINRRHKELESISDSRINQNTHFKFSDLTLEDTTRYNIMFKDYPPIVSCDFVSLFEDDESAQNVLLQDGDIIEIPSNPGHVYVYGYVTNPGFVDFKEGANKEFYINLAGGLQDAADEDRIRVIRGVNKVWNENSVVYAGDIVFVPGEPDIPSNVKVQEYGMWTGVVSATASLLFILSQIIK